MTRIGRRRFHRILFQVSFVSCEFVTALSAARYRGVWLAVASLLALLTSSSSFFEEFALLTSALPFFSDSEFN